VPFLSRRLLRGQDAVVATAWQTAEMVAKLNLGLRGFYFIQHHETWAGEESRVNATWRLPLTRVVIASWLEDVARNLGALPVTVIPNAIDIEKFCVVKPVDQRPAARVAMLWHGATWKRSADGLTALKMAQQEVPELSAVMFSRLERPIDMPDWVEWHHDATSAKVAEIMNSASIFLTPSEAEGWALPPAEALACGCALVATNIGGHHDYAIADRTAVLVPVGDTDSMASAIVQLVSNDRLRVGLGTSGANLMRDEFSWAASTDRLLLVLTSAAGLASAK
jgi:glycosyltransferase involved in cell wall biosynthesis